MKRILACLFFFSAVSAEEVVKPPTLTEDPVPPDKQQTEEPEKKGGVSLEEITSGFEKWNKDLAESYAKKNTLDSESKQKSFLDWQKSYAGKKITLDADVVEVTKTAERIRAAHAIVQHIHVKMINRGVIIDAVCDKIKSVELAKLEKDDPVSFSGKIISISSPQGEVLISIEVSELKKAPK